MDDNGHQLLRKRERKGGKRIEKKKGQKKERKLLNSYFACPKFSALVDDKAEF